MYVPTVQIKMLRFPILTASLALISIIYGADHDTFKDCSRIPFCSRLRGKTVEAASQFAANIFELKKDNRIATIPLTNSNGEVLSLEITLLNSNTARVRVYEENHNRFELPYVLQSEPSPIAFSDVNVANETLTLTPQIYPYPYKILVRSGPPFSVEFFEKDQLEVVLNADNLIMENTEDSKAFSFKVEFEGAARLYGLFEHAYKLALDETADGSMDPFRLRNSDVYEYEVESPMALYGSVPVLYGHSIDSTSGIFIHNAAEEWIDISYKDRPSANFILESGVLDFFVFLGPDPQSVVRQYTTLVGVAPLPQLWTLGYHQCRFTYESQEDVKTVVANMIKYDFPMDVLWLDDGHSNKNRYFEWNPENFTDPIEMQRNVSAVGKKFVSISDPHIKIADDYPVYTGAKGKYFVKWANGSDFEGECWPGLSSYIDFLNPEASEYYAGWYAYNKFNETTETLAGIWNDMNEPSVFDDSLEKTLPFEVLHYGNVPHRDVHNIYGFLQTRATHEGLLQRDNRTKRPFILTRSFFAGSQRYAAIWTGDNAGDWSYLSTSLSQCLTANMLGIVYCGADVGGFQTEPTNELLQRWYQAAVWLPFYRGHSGKETPRREPYLFPDGVQSVIRNALKLRYKHIPVFYTLAFRHWLYGDPIIRPLFYEYHDLFEYDDHVLIGSDILARPVLDEGAETVEVTFPGAETYWYRVDDDSFDVHYGGTTEDIAVDITSSPFFYRGGSIITRKDIEKLSTTYMVDDPYTLYVNVDSTNSAVGFLYVDDYTSFEYEVNDSYIYILFEYLSDSGGIRIRQIDGDSTGIDIYLQRIVIHQPPTNGINKGVPTTYTTTADGIPLASINIVQKFKTRNTDFILYL